jgi:hypothetical protein
MLMYIIKQVNRGYFTGMVYHGECGWHAGFQHVPLAYDLDIIKYNTETQAEQQKMFLEEMFHETNLIVEVW